MNFELLHGDCLELMKSLPDESVDAVVTDPPYGILTGHKIETDVDIPRFFRECYRVLKPNSFICFFGMLPKSLEWLNVATHLFKFQNHVVWHKRNGSHGGNLNALRRFHEDFYIFRKGAPSYYKTEGYYDDVMRPRVEEGYASIESVFRELSYYRGIANGKNLVNTCGPGEALDKYHYRKFHGKKVMLGREVVGFSTVWVFYHENKKNRKHNGVRHPTLKPVEFMNRAVELTTQEGDLVLDPFMGSGTTGVACRELGRRFIGMELHEEYFNIAKTRILNSGVEGNQLTLFHSLEPDKDTISSSDDKVGHQYGLFSPNQNDTKEE